MNDIERAINLHKDLLDMAEYSRATYEDFCGTADLTKEERKRVYDDMDKKINMHRAVISALEEKSDKNCSRCVDRNRCAIHDNFNIDYCSDWSVEE